MEKVQRLAPATLVFERARRLVGKGSWQELGRSGTVIWGLCRTSGATSYRVAVDLHQERFFSNSPVARKPDKYILGLLLLFHYDPEALDPPAAEPPPWAVEGLRNARHDPDAAARTADRAEQKARSQEKRLTLMTEGAEELQLWLEDAMRQGIASLQAQPDDFWNAIAARMVDAKLGGVSRRLQRLQRLRTAAGWTDLAMETLADLQLLVQALFRLDDLPEPLQREALVQAGMNLRKEEVLQEKAVVDYWLILSQELTEEDQLRARRTWIWGERLRQPALLLDFAWGNQPFEQRWEVGAAFDGAVVYYPLAYPQRALVKDFRLEKRPFTGPRGFPDWEKAFAHYRQALSANPWTYRFPLLLEQVQAVKTTDGLVISDREGRSAPIEDSGNAGWKLLALTLDGPVSIFGEWSGRTFYPLTAFSGDRLIPLR